MKLFAIAILFSLPVFAKTVDVECVMKEQAYRNQFSISFSFDDEATTFEDQSFDFKVRKNTGRDAQTTDLNLVRSGTIKVFPGGDLTRNPYTILPSIDKDADVPYMNLAVDFPQNFTSTLRFKDGWTFAGTCKTK